MLKPLSDEEAPGLQSALPNDIAVAGSAPAISTPPVVSDVLPVTSINAEPQGLRRRAEARKIVERHKMYAAVGGLLPLPVVNVAGVTAIILRMMKALSKLYQVPFERDRTRSIVVGLMGGAVPTGLAAATSSTLAFVIPGSGLVGLAVSSVSAAAFTRGIGLVFIDHFESGIKGGQ
jgi:uncharacterized protein (DUF697 family)